MRDSASGLDVYPALSRRAVPSSVAHMGDWAFVF